MLVQMFTLTCTSEGVDLPLEEASAGGSAEMGAGTAYQRWLCSTAGHLHSRKDA